MEQGLRDSLLSRHPQSLGCPMALSPEPSPKAPLASTNFGQVLLLLLSSVPLQQCQTHLGCPRLGLQAMGCPECTQAGRDPSHGCQELSAAQGRIAFILLRDPSPPSVIPFLSTFGSPPSSSQHLPCFSWVLGLLAVRRTQWQKFPLVFFFWPPDVLFSLVATQEV